MGNDRDDGAAKLIRLLDAVRRYLPELAARGVPGDLIWFVRWMTLFDWLL